MKKPIKAGNSQLPHHNQTETQIPNKNFNPIQIPTYDQRLTTTKQASNQHQGKIPSVSSTHNNQQATASTARGTMFSSRGLGRGCRLLLFFALLLLLFGTIANVQGGEPKPPGRAHKQAKPNQRGNQSGSGQDVPLPLMPGQEGFGKHTLTTNGKVQLAPGWDEEGKVNSDCEFKVDGEHITFSHKKGDPKACSVDLVKPMEDGKDEFEFVAILEAPNNDDLDKCLTDDPFVNTLPINYGRSNKELDDFVKGPIYNENAEGCQKDKCTDPEGKCMDSTSLEVMWGKNAEEMYVGLLHLISDLAHFSTPLSWTKEEAAGKKSFALHVKVTKSGEAGSYEIHKEETPTEIVKSEDVPEPVCIDPEKAVPPPRFWPIADATDKEGKPMRLLVFHLLPPTASRISIADSPMDPLCNIFIKFPKNMLLSKDTVKAMTTSTEGPTTTTTRESKTTTGQNITTALQRRRRTTATTSPQRSEKPKSTDDESSLNIWIILLIVGGVLLLLAVVGFLVWFCACRGKKDADSGEEGEAGENGAAAGDEEEQEQRQEVEEADVGEQLV